MKVDILASHSLCISCAHIEEDVHTHTHTHTHSPRFIVLGSLMSILTHIGYHVDWKQMIVITWGGLRGAVGLALALVVAQTSGVPLGSIGSKVRS